MTLMAIRERTKVELSDNDLSKVTVLVDPSSGIATLTGPPGLPLSAANLTTLQALLARAQALLIGVQPSRAEATVTE